MWCRRWHSANCTKCTAAGRLTCTKLYPFSTRNRQSNCIGTIPVYFRISGRTDRPLYIRWCRNNFFHRRQGYNPLYTNRSVRTVKCGSFVGMDCSRTMFYMHPIHRFYWDNPRGRRTPDPCRCSFHLYNWTFLPHNPGSLNSYRPFHCHNLFRRYDLRNHFAYHNAIPIECISCSRIRIRPHDSHCTMLRLRRVDIRPCRYTLPLRWGKYFCRTYTGTVALQWPDQILRK